MATAAFFAPLISTSPWRGFPPLITYFCQNGTFFYMVLRNEIGSKAIRNAKPGPSPNFSLYHIRIFRTKMCQIRRGERLVLKAAFMSPSVPKQGRKETNCLHFVRNPGPKKGNFGALA